MSRPQFDAGSTRPALRAGAVLSFPVMALLACGGSPVEPTAVPGPAAGMVDNGSWYRSGFHWPHDGNPFESEHFTVFSDAASLAARQQLAQIAEGALGRLRSDLGVSESMFSWPPGQSKIHIYTFRDHHERGWGGKGYYGGLMIYSLDHPVRTSMGVTGLDTYTRVVTHELMHTIEGLLKGSDDPHLVDEWLSEGIAEYVSGGTQSIPIVTTLAQVDELVARFGALNPIAMHGNDYPGDIAITGAYYYVMFELSVRYLLDPAGGGRPGTAIRDIDLDVRSGIPFATAFRDHMGLGLEEFERRYWDLIREYLR